MAGWLVRVPADDGEVGAREDMPKARWIYRRTRRAATRLEAGGRSIAIRHCVLNGLARLSPTGFHRMSSIGCGVVRSPDQSPEQDCGAFGDRIGWRGRQAARGSRHNSAARRVPTYRPWRRAADGGARRGSSAGSAQAVGASVESAARYPHANAVGRARQQLSAGHRKAPRAGPSDIETAVPRVRRHVSGRR